VAIVTERIRLGALWWLRGFQKAGCPLEWRPHPPIVHAGSEVQRCWQCSAERGGLPFEAHLAWPALQELSQTVAPGLDAALINSTDPEQRDRLVGIAISLLDAALLG
jgi:hypothetical protein